MIRFSSTYFTYPSQYSNVFFFNAGNRFYYNILYVLDLSWRIDTKLYLKFVIWMI